MAEENTTNTQCLYSTVKNTSGITKRFGFLPPHGKQLAANEEYTVFGNILEALTRYERVTDRRIHQAFVAAVDRGDIVIVETPALVLQDITTQAIKTVTLDNGSLTVTDPCWDDQFSDSLDDVPA